MNGWEPFVSDVEGRFVAASNATLLGTTRDGETVVYKPIQGERPLWDFPSETLAIREVLTYRISELLGIGVVPETVLGDGVFGRGSVQRFVDFDDDWDAVASIQAGDEALWPLAVLDIVCNNADRKIGHILRTQDGRIFGIDHGLTFHSDEKLRTVLWCFSGETVPPTLVAGLAALGDGLDGEHGRVFRSELNDREWKALRSRLATLLSEPRHPHPPTDRPPLPWPAY